MYAFHLPLPLSFRSPPLLTTTLSPTRTPNPLRTPRPHLHKNPHTKISRTCPSSQQQQQLELSTENVEHVLQQARENLSGVFGYTDESRQVGITGSVELGEVEGGCVVLRFAGRFWHRRSDVLKRLEAFIKERIPETLEVLVEDDRMLLDSEEESARVL